MAGGYVINQHYVSQCVLKHFANQKNQVVECLVESGKIYSTNYENSMVERDTYEHPELERNTIEKYFQNIESIFGPTLTSIINTIGGYEKGVNQFDDIKNLVYQLMPDFIKFYYRSKALLTELDFERTNKADKLYLMMDNIANSNYIKSLSKTLIDYYDFAIIKSLGAEFLLSDQYLSTVALAIKNSFMFESNRHMGMKDVMLFIPITANYYVALYNGDKPWYISRNSINNLSQEQIDEVNEVIINNSYLKCIGKYKASIQRVLPKFEYKSPVETIAGGSGFTFGATLKKEVFLYKRDRLAWELFTGLEFGRYIDLQRNEKCACGSGKKYENCCFEIGEICKRMYKDIEYSRYDYLVSDAAVIERPLAEFYTTE